MAKNTKEYPERMGMSIPLTTKGKIPELISKYKIKSLLDVGCADGRFTEVLAASLPKNVTIDAIDTCSDGGGDDSHIKKTGRVNYYITDFANVPYVIGKTYDCIVFSSVMHEISSYCEDDGEKYSQKPIFNTLKTAYGLLNPGGVVVVRDMVKPSWKTRSVPVEMLPFDNAVTFLKFITECPYLKPEYDKCFETKFFAYDTGDRILFNVRNDVLMEFLMTATWGPESMDREIMEKKFILKKGDWKKAFQKAGLAMEHYEETNEEYPMYFDRLVRIWEPMWKYPATTCLMVGVKAR